jgi:hypothetical protein
MQKMEAAAFLRYGNTEDLSPEDWIACAYREGDNASDVELCSSGEILSTLRQLREVMVSVGTDIDVYPIVVE